MTDILASWSSLLSVCTVLRAESISRGPQASWAFRQHAYGHVTHTHYAAQTGCQRTVYMLYLLSLNKIKENLGLPKPSEQHLTEIATNVLHHWDESCYLEWCYIKIPSGWQSWARPGRLPSSWHIGLVASQQPGQPLLELLTLQTSPSYFQAERRWHKKRTTKKKLIKEQFLCVCVCLMTKSLIVADCVESITCKKLWLAMMRASWAPSSSGWAWLLLIPWTKWGMLSATACI